jgi:hypothetical protein
MLNGWTRCPQRFLPFIIHHSYFRLLPRFSVPDFLNNLLAARDQIAQNLADMTANPKPNYKIDGQVVSWQGLFDSYLSQLEKLNAQIAAADPFEIHSRGFTGP